MKKLKLTFVNVFLCAFLCGCSISSSATAVQVTSPVSGSTVSSPVAINAKANPGPRITRWGIYVDGVSVWSTGATATINPSIAMSAGTHNVVIRAWNSNGTDASANLTLTVPDSTPAPSVSISISPSSATLTTGTSAQFTASVGGTTNTSVIWLVNGTQGGNPTVGTISSGGLYQAPTAVPSGSSVTVTAKSVADTTKSANASVTITAAPAPVSVSISPGSAALQTGASAQFTASVSGTTNTGVTWLVSGVQGGNSTVGTISSGGLYTAPAAVPSGSSATVTARSVADTTKSANASVSILAAPTPVSVSISPTSATVQTGLTKQFSASVTGTTNTGIAWQVAGVTGGNSTVGLISSNGLYTAPVSVPASNPVTVTARSAYDSTASANAAVTVTGNSGPSLYVSTSGNDSNNCTASAPCLTLNRADALATPGTTVHVAAGTYIGPFRVTHSGTASAHIVFVSDVKWGAELTTSIAGTSETLRSDGQYVELRNFEITGAGVNGIVINGSYSSAIGNHVHDIIDAACGGGGGIQSWGNNTITGTSYIGNVVHDIGNPDSSTPCTTEHGIYEGNTHGTILNNIVYRTSGYGIHLWHAASDALIANNTVFNSRMSGIIVGGGDSGVTTTGDDNTSCFNNISVNNSAYGIIQHGTVGPHNVFKNNLLYGNKSGAVYALTDSSRVAADPLFVNYNPTGNGDYHLQSASPGVDAGIGSAPAGTNPGVAPSYDFDGNPRPTGNGYDIGAYELP